MKYIRRMASGGGFPLANTASMASAGATFGPWGAAGGAAVGGVMDIMAYKKGQKEKKRLKVIEDIKEGEESYTSLKKYMQPSNANRSYQGYKQGAKLPDMKNSRLLQRMMATGGAMDQAMMGGMPPQPNEGMLEGATHEEGGMPVVDPETGEPVANVEGGERLFSQEDSSAIEELSIQAMEAEESNPQEAMQIFAELGKFVAASMLKQDEVNPPQEQPPMGDMLGAGGGGMPPEGGGMPPEMMRDGGSFKSKQGYLNHLNRF